MTAQVIALKQASVNAIIKQARAAWDRADEKKADADAWYVRTGKLLLELKARTPYGQWISALKKIGRTSRQASELMQIASGETTLEKVRKGRRERVQKSRAKSALRNADLAKPKSALRNADLSETEDDDDFEEEEQGDTPEEQWQWSLANLAGDIIAVQAYWDKNFPEWKTYTVPSHIKTSVKEAATVYASLAKTIAQRR